MSKKIIEAQFLDALPLNSVVGLKNSYRVPTKG